MLDQFLEQLFAPDQSQGWSPMMAGSTPPNFNQRFDAMGPAASAPPNDISALLPRGTNFTPSPGVGAARLKSELAGVYDAAGTDHPDSPHYSESQDATTAAARAVHPDVYPDTPGLGAGGDQPPMQPPNPLMPPAAPDQQFAGMPGADMGNNMDRMLAGNGYRDMGDNNPTPVINPDQMMQKLNGGANLDPTFNQNAAPYGTSAPPNQGIMPEPPIDPGVTQEMSAQKRSAMPPGGGPSATPGDPLSAEAPKNGAAHPQRGEAIARAREAIGQGANHDQVKGWLNDKGLAVTDDELRGGSELRARPGGGPGAGPSPDSIDSRLMGGGNMPPGGNGPAPLSLDPNGGQPGAQPGGSGNPIFDRLAGVFGTKLLNAAQSGHPEARSVLGRLMGMDKRGDQQMRASLAGGMAGGNPNFKLGAAMKGAGGAMGGGLGQENIQDQQDVALAAKQQAQSNFDRSQAEKEQTGVALRNLYGARADYATNGRPNNSWNKPGPERWKDASRLIIDKQKQLDANTSPSNQLGMNKAAREAAKAAAANEMADFKRQTYEQYGFTPDGKDAAPQTGARPGGPVPSSSRVIGDKEAEDAGLYDKPMSGSGTYNDPHVLGGSTDDEQRQQFSGIKSGAIFINPKTYNDAIDEGLSPDEAKRRATMSK